jgi:hypothetical protein
MHADIGKPYHVHDIFLQAPEHRQVPFHTLIFITTLEINLDFFFALVISLFIDLQHLP